MALTTFVAGNVLTAAQLNDSFAAVGGARAIVPTSVTVTGVGSSGTVGTNGTVTFGTAASVSLNGCFSVDFRNYLVVCDMTYSTTGVNGQMRMRASGSDNSSANSYVREQLYATSTTVGASRTTSNEWASVFSGSSGLTAGWVAVFLRPFLADSTGLHTNVIDTQSAAQVDVCVGTHNQTVSYDGFSFYPNSGTISGTVTVYGLFG
jgi:hypothetical protein